MCTRIAFTVHVYSWYRFSVVFDTKIRSFCCVVHLSFVSCCRWKQQQVNETLVWQWGWMRMAVVKPGSTNWSGNESVERKTVWLKKTLPLMSNIHREPKTCHPTFVHNFCKCRAISKIFSLLNWSRNFQHSWGNTFHRTVNNVAFLPWEM